MFQPLTCELSSYSSEGSAAALTVVVVDVVIATAELSRVV